MKIYRLNLSEETRCEKLPVSVFPGQDTASIQVTRQEAMETFVRRKF